MVTAETAVAVPAVVLVLALALSGLSLGVDAVRCQDAARVVVQQHGNVVAVLGEEGGTVGIGEDRDGPRLDRAGVLVVGPNAAFLDHISAVLPSLGEARVAHATIETLLDGSYRDDTPKNRRWLVRGADEAQVAVLKGWSNYACYGIL